MRKQTKVVAVASAAALLAIGASMTSFAAYGWTPEDGTWYYYDKDGNRVEDEWRKSVDGNWYWLDSEENGAMATDKLIDDDGDIYYVDSEGVMVTNTWVKVVNEDQDDSDPAEYRYYYMQANGKAFTAPESSDTVRFRTIDGKRYAFDDDGKMLYGWVTADGDMQNEEDGWVDATYYLGSWEDGAMKTGWNKVTVFDETKDDDMDYWFNFKSNGKKRVAGEEEEIAESKINGKRYAFDKRGVMTYQWTVATGDGATSGNWKYFNSPEDGARVTKGWFKVVAPADDNDNTFAEYDKSFASADAADENERWYYADGNGNLATGEIKKIGGKYYGFRPEGDRAAAMLSGLVLLETEGDKITRVIDDGVDSDELSDILDGTYEDMTDTATLFYFGDADTDGSMKTGATTVNVDGDSYNFLFSKSGGAESKGRGLTGIDDNKYIYKYGCRIKAGSDDKYLVVSVKNESDSDATDVGAAGVEVAKISSSDLRKAATDTFKNDDDETVRYNKIEDSTYYLVNTSGSIQKNKTAAKDGDDWYFYVEDYNVKLYTNNKNLDDKATDKVKENWEDWAGIAK